MARAMKESGIEWIGEIPENWDIVKTKHRFTNHKDIAGEKSDEYERLALTLGGVIKRPKDDSNGLQPEAFDGYQILRENELVFKLIDLANVATSRVGYSPYTGIVSPAYIILTPNEKSESLYGVYFFLSMWQREIFNHMGDDGVRSSLNASDLLNIPYISIPADERRRIVNFLDRKCAEIDSVIANTQKTIEEYKVLKQSIITEAVTKGVRGNRPMKDSGIEWIGQIPEEWKLQKLKNIASLITDGTHVTPNYIDSGIPFVSIKDISSGEIDFSDVKYISQEEHELLSKSTPIEKGDMLFTRIGTLGVFVIVNTDTVFDIFVSVGLIKFKTSISDKTKQFIRYFLLSSCTLNYINLVKAGGGTAAAKYNLTDVRNTLFVVPSLTEQEEIVNHLDKKCSELDTIIQGKCHLLTELETYKKSVIYEYVTGKKEVPA